MIDHPNCPVCLETLCRAHHVCHNCPELGARYQFPVLSPVGPRRAVLVAPAAFWEEVDELVDAVQEALGWCPSVLVGPRGPSFKDPPGVVRQEIVINKGLCRAWHNVFQTAAEAWPTEVPRAAAWAFRLAVDCPELPAGAVAETSLEQFHLGVSLEVYNP